MAPNSVEILWELGVGSRLVGVSRYTVYPPQLAHVPRIGGQRDPNLEAIVTLGPDLVILRGRQEKLEKLCRDRGIAVFYDPTNRLSDVYETITRLGAMFDRVEQADALCRRVRERLARVQGRAAGRPAVKVLLTMRGPDRLANIGTVGQGSYLHELIELAGGENVFGDLDVAYPQVSIEEIVVRRPEVIIEVSPGGRPAGGYVQLAEQWHPLRQIPAVRNGRVHVLTEDYAMIPSPRLVLLAEKLLSLLHPDVAD
ncbi:MAG: ABC transporter substrate-binding protein [Phycisphaerales bacterium]|nr:MAG: ABC transporter substrate-binding protein [Phycisphaerales bacterium]